MQEYDFYLLGLACISLSSKNLSIHYGSLNNLSQYYVQGWADIQPNNIEQGLEKGVNKEATIKAFYPRVHEELHRVEFEIFKLLRLELTKIDRLPLLTLRKFMVTLLDSKVSSSKTQETMNKIN